jgi:CRISPR-associated protein Cmr4
MNCIYLYLIAPLHTGGATQEGNLLGIAREAHTRFPYIPSSTIRGRMRSLITDRVKKAQWFGPDLKDLEDSDFLADYKTQTEKELHQLEQGSLWMGDGSILWLPVPSISHGVIWVSCPLLLKRWQRITGNPTFSAPVEYGTNLSNANPIYLKDAIIGADELQAWGNWSDFVPEGSDEVQRVLVLPDQHCATVFQMSLWRQVKVKLDEHKTVDGGFRYEESIPPDTLMYFPWGSTTQSRLSTTTNEEAFRQEILSHDFLQIGGQESLGRGFVQFWSDNLDVVAEV